MFSQRYLINFNGEVSHRSALAIMPELVGAMNELRARQYLVKNCGYIDVEIDRDLFQFRAKRRTLTLKSVIGLCYLLSDAHPNRTLARWLEANGSLAEIIPSDQSAAFDRLVACICLPGDSSEQPRVLRKSISLKTLPASSPLSAALQTFTTSKMGSKAAVAERLNSCAHGRYVFVDLIKHDGALTFSGVGPGIPECAKGWITKAIGQELKSQPDKEYAAYCHAAYGFVALSGQPLLEAVDAIVHWPHFPEQRRRYFRLIARMTEPNGSRWLASVSLPDATIDLRRGLKIVG